MVNTYDHILTKGPESALPVIPEDGKLRLTTDTGRLFIDGQNSRTEVTDFVKGLTEAEIKSQLAPLASKIYISSDTNKFLIYDGTAVDPWINIANSGQADYATNAGTSVYATNAGTATHASTADYSTNSGTATYGTNAGTAVHASTADYATNASSADYATNASSANFATNSTSATYATNAGTATEANHAASATNASTSTYATNAGTATYATNSGTATYGTNAGTAVHASTADYATKAGTATYGTNAGTATYATNAGSAVYATSAASATDTTKVAKAGDLMTGCLTIETIGITDFREGIRINSADNGWASLLIGGANGSTSGISDNAFWIGTCASSFSRKLFITHNGSNKDTFFYASSANDKSPSLQLGGELKIGGNNGPTIKYNSTTQSIDFIFG